MENQWFIDVSTTGDGKDSGTFFLNKNLYQNLTKFGVAKKCDRYKSLNAFMTEVPII